MSIEINLVKLIQPKCFSYLFLMPPPIKTLPHAVSLRVIHSGLHNPTSATRDKIVLDDIKRGVGQNGDKNGYTFEPGPK